MGRAASARPGRNNSAPGSAGRTPSRRCGSALAPKWPISAYRASPPVTHSTTAPSDEERHAFVHDAEAAARRSADSASKIYGCGTISIKPNAADGHEPQHHDRPEDAADAASAVTLHGKKGRPGSPRCRSAAHRVAARGGDLEPLDRRQHRDRGRDHAVAEKQAGAERCRSARSRS